jgi:CMP-N,N'-diacetyllegionaminic acid synthase
MKISTIITARGGSKGIPNKNIKNLNNKPLIAHTIQASILNKNVQKTYVSSENDKIIEISENYGAEIIKRPSNLSQDDSSSIDVILHSLNYLKENDKLPDMFILLQPTSPLRTSEDITNAINIFNENDCESVVSVSKIDHSAMLSLIKKNEYLTSFNDENFLKMRRQDLPELYCPNGAIYISKPEYIEKNLTFFPEKTIPYTMPQERSIDIDTEFDLKIAELILKEQESDKNNINKK